MQTALPHPPLIGAAPSPPLREVQRVPKRKEYHPDGLHYQDEGYQQELEQSKPEELALAPPFDELEASAAEHVPSVEVVLLELLAAQPAPLVVASPTHIVTTWICW